MSDCLSEKGTVLSLVDANPPIITQPPVNFQSSAQLDRTIRIPALGTRTPLSRSAPIFA
jgi:hypothetical protein